MRHTLCVIHYASYTMRHTLCVIHYASYTMRHTLTLYIRHNSACLQTPRRGLATSVTLCVCRQRVYRTLHSTQVLRMYSGVVFVATLNMPTFSSYTRTFGLPYSSPVNTSRLFYPQTPTFCGGPSERSFTVSSRPLNDTTNWYADWDTFAERDRESESPILGNISHTRINDTSN